MRSSNPILSKQGSFTHGGQPQGYPQAPGYPYAPGQPYGGAPTAAQLHAMYGTQPTMTWDDVVAKTAITLIALVVAGAATWVVLPPQAAIGAAVAGGLIAFVVAMIAIFKRNVSPPLIIAYALFEGVFLGGTSKLFEMFFPGIITQAVLGTVLVFAVMLFAYRSGRIRVTPKFVRFVLVAAVAFLVLALVNLVAGFFVDGGLGLREGPLGLAFGAVGVLLGALFLALDFHEVDQAIAYGAPAKEAWRAAFGLTLSLVWIFLELRNILAILSDD